MTTVGILSDVHMRKAYRTEVTETLEAVRAALDRRDPDHIFVLGDLINESDDPETDRQHVSLVDELLDELSAPVTYLLGNHDTVTLTRDEVGELLGQETFYGRVNVGTVPFVYLDSSRTGNTVTGELGEHQREWLKSTLPADAIVLLHHPVGPFSLTDNPWFADDPDQAYLRDRQETLDVLSGRARATISGHIHQTSCVRHRNLTHLSVNAISKETADIPVTGTWALLDLEGEVTADIFVRDRQQISFTLD